MKVARKVFLCNLLEIGGVFHNHTFVKLGYSPPENLLPRRDIRLALSPHHKDAIYINFQRRIIDAGMKILGASNTMARNSNAFGSFGFDRYRFRNTSETALIFMIAESKRLPVRF